MARGSDWIGIPPRRLHLPIPHDLACALLLEYPLRYRAPRSWDGQRIQPLPGSWRAAPAPAGWLAAYALEHGPLPALVLAARIGPPRPGTDSPALDLGGWVGLAAGGPAGAAALALAGAIRDGLLLDLAGLARREDDWSPTPADKRASARQSLELAVRLRVSNALWWGISRDVGPGGVGLLLPDTELRAAHAPSGAPERGALELLGLPSPAVVRVNLRWIRPNPEGMALGLELSHAEEWQRLLRALRAGEMLR